MSISYDRLIDSTHERWGEAVRLFDGSSVTAIPNYLDELQQTPDGQVIHLVGWELVFKPSVTLIAGDRIVWREVIWRVNLPRKLLTNLRVMVTEL